MNKKDEIESCEQGRILVKEGYFPHIKQRFQNALDSLRMALSVKDLEDVGLTLDTETVRDVLSAGGVSEMNVHNNLQKQLPTSGVLPVVARNNENMYRHFMQGFKLSEKKAREAIKEFDYIPIDCFFVDSMGLICVNEEGQQKVNDACNLYLDLPEQLEVYGKVKELLSSIDELQSVVSKYGCNVFGNAGILTLVANQPILLPGVIAECHSNGAWTKTK